MNLTYCDCNAVYMSLDHFLFIFYSLLCNTKLVMSPISIQVYSASFTCMSATFVLTILLLCSLNMMDKDIIPQISNKTRDRFFQVIIYQHANIYHYT